MDVRAYDVCSVLPLAWADAVGVRGLELNCSLGFERLSFVLRNDPKFPSFFSYGWHDSLLGWMIRG